jgi:hypothetical protein
MANLPQRTRRLRHRRSARGVGCTGPALPRSLRAITRRYNLEREPLTTGQRSPRVSLRAGTAFALSPWHQSRRTAGLLAGSVVIALFAAWNLALFLGR